MKLLAILIAFASISLGASCQVLGSSAGCPCSGTQNPCIQAFIAGATTSFNSMLSSIAGIPTPKVINSLEIPPATSSYRNADTVGCNTPTNVCVFSTAVASTISIGLNAYIDNAIIDAGATALVYNFDPLYYTQAPQYLGSCTPTDPTWMAYQLSVDLAFLTHAKNAGLAIYLSSSPLPNIWNACGYTAGSVTTIQWNSAVDPMNLAAVAFLAAHSITVTLMLPEHEPNGYNQIATQNATAFTPTQYTGLVSTSCGNLITSFPSILCGSGFTAGDSTYVSYYLANVINSTMIGLETYGPALSQNYASTMNTLVGFASTAITDGFLVYNTEGDPPRHVPASGGGSEANTYEGCAWDTGTQGWQTWNLNNAFSQVMPRFVSANGFKNVIRFSTQPYAAFDPNSSQNCFSSSLTSGATAYVMEHSTGPTPAAQGWLAGNIWSGVFLNSVFIKGVLIQ